MRETWSLLSCPVVVIQRETTGHGFNRISRRIRIQQRDDKEDFGQNSKL